jgi:hypothetical protein
VNTVSAQPETQDDVLAATLAALTDAGIPPGDASRALPDPGGERHARAA